MATRAHDTTSTIVRDPKSGRTVTVKGMGVLKGRITIDKGVDLTRPISGQTIERTKPSRKPLVEQSKKPR